MDNALIPSTGNLWNLSGQLMELLQEREEIGARVARPGPDLDAAMAELVAIDSAIRDFVVQKVSEVDEVRRPILAMRDAAGVCRAEASRAENQALAWDRRADQIEAIVRQCMEAMEQAGVWKPKQTRKIVSALGSLTLKGNGGVRPLVVTDEALIPDEFCTVEVRMSATQWRKLAVEATIKVRREISNTLIREAMEKPCPACCGAPGECESCGGTGLNGVPGAHLGERGTSLVVR